MIGDVETIKSPPYKQRQKEKIKDYLNIKRTLKEHHKSAHDIQELWIFSAVSVCFSKIVSSKILLLKSEPNWGFQMRKTQMALKLLEYKRVEWH